jgi:hypothetical protein
LTDPNFSWTVGFKEFAHPATETFSTIAQAGPTFFLAIAMFGFVFQISALVTEKELKLRQVRAFLVSPHAFYDYVSFIFVEILDILMPDMTTKYGTESQAMSIMGLYESAYWLSWLTWEAFLTLISALFTVLFGMMFQFDFFLNNSFGILFLLFFLFQLNMVSSVYLFCFFLFEVLNSDKYHASINTFCLCIF